MTVSCDKTTHTLNLQKPNQQIKFLMITKLIFYVSLMTETILKFEIKIILKSQSCYVCMKISDNQLNQRVIICRSKRLKNINT